MQESYGMGSWQSVLQDEESVHEDHSSQQSTCQETCLSCEDAGDVEAVGSNEPKEPAARLGR